MKKKIKKIVIIGGGTAGWATALNFFQRAGDSVKIHVVASKELPIIGVGESTTGQFNDLMHIDGSFDELDFLVKTGSTFKFGIKHTDWHTIGESFISPLGDNVNNKTLKPSFTYDFYRFYHVANKLPMRGLQSRLMLDNKLPFLNIEKDGPYSIDPFNNQHGQIRFFDNFHHAYHLDTYKVGQYIKEKLLLQERVSYSDDTISGWNVDHNGFLKSVIGDSHEEIEGDLFVDCTGFKRLLVDKLEDNNFVSYENELHVNSALTFHIENNKNTIINNYTEVIAKKYGWLWDIPLQHRKGMGYVFDDNYINADEAQDEIEKDLGIKIDPQSVIKFTPGRMEKFWTKNVISTGLSSAFLEPLEATSIHMTVLQINHFIENYFTHDLVLDNLQIDNYNKDIATTWDDLRDFILLHYQTPRNDTEFWVDASSRRSDRLNSLMYLWKTRMPRNRDYELGAHLFFNLGNTLWVQILMGMKLLDSKIAKKELKAFGLWEWTKDLYEKRIAFETYVMDRACPNNNFYFGSKYKT